ncbi:hypothetical protein QLH52_08545 [Methylomonas sp. OY6]|uniref:Secreted protein with PEP-CTERM sorting signal n=1 Tax=Methylomonas defluvii TaxID=3045149 RepID=A0ABU4UD19_9GAMM|nr:hypothetical protein [Methylomonas sp. OY6]MDX8127326.1 hypothetical protein [Methylomonas sp. OY6]
MQALSVLTKLDNADFQGRFGTSEVVLAASKSLIDNVGGIMGPYYRGTSQSTGAFFDMFYQHPILTVVLVVATIGAGFLLMRGKKSE